MYFFSLYLIQSNWIYMLFSNVKTFVHIIGTEVNGIRALTHCFLLAFGWWRLLWCRHYDGGRGRVHSLSWVVWWPSCGNWGWNRGWNRWGVPEGIWGCTQETGGKHFSKTPIWHFAITVFVWHSLTQHIDMDGVLMQVEVSKQLLVLQKRRWGWGVMNTSCMWEIFWNENTHPLSAHTEH